MSAFLHERITRTRKIALIPAPKQLRLLEQHAAYARDAYNWALAWVKDRRKAGEPWPSSMLFPFWQDARATLYPHYGALCHSAAQYAVYALGDAIKACEDEARPNRFPRFHRQDYKPAFRADNGKGSIRCHGRRIELPVIGSLRMVRPLRPQGRILEVTVTHEAGRWWACVAVEMKRPPRSTGTRIIGVDVGLGTIAVCSDGVRYEIPEELKTLRREVGGWPARSKAAPGKNRSGSSLSTLATGRSVCVKNCSTKRPGRSSPGPAW